MKKNILLVLAINLMYLVNAQKGAYLEYKIKSSKGATGTVKLNFSEPGSVSEFSMAIPQMPGGGIVNKSLNKKSNPDVVYMINDKNKTYSELKKTTGENNDSKNYTVSKMGEETVNGYKCSLAVVTDGLETYEVWNTKDVAEYSTYAAELNANKKLGSTKRQDALKSVDCDGFPVKTIHRGNEREGDVTMELVKLEKKNFTKTDFEIPVGYTKTEQGAVSPAGGPQVKSQQELMNMTPEERAKYVEEMKKKYGK